MAKSTAAFRIKEWEDGTGVKCDFTFCCTATFGKTPEGRRKYIRGVSPKAAPKAAQACDRMLEGEYMRIQCGTFSDVNDCKKDGGQSPRSHSIARFSIATFSRFRSTPWIHPLHSKLKVAIGRKNHLMGWQPPAELRQCGAWPDATQDHGRCIESGLVY